MVTGHHDDDRRHIGRGGPIRAAATQLPDLMTFDHVKLGMGATLLPPRPPRRRVALSAELVRFAVGWVMAGIDGRFVAALWSDRVGKWPAQWWIVDSRPIMIIIGHR